MDRQTGVRENPNNRIMRSLLARFKKKFEECTEYKVSWNDLDKDGNLIVGIVDNEGNEKFWLHVVERNGQIEWF